MIDKDTLDDWSYLSQAGKSLKNTLRKFDLDALVDDVESAIAFYNQHDDDVKETLSDINYLASYRVKSIQSVRLKFKRHGDSREVSSLCNDLLEIRLITDYKAFLKELEDSCVPLRMVDMRAGKACDDGYRGLHLYYQKDKHHYPIELQIWDDHDARFNTWMHINAYKKTEADVGKRLRERYDEGTIRNESEFEEALNNELYGS